MKSINLSRESFKHYGSFFKAHGAVLFVLFLLVVYGLLTWKIQQLMQQEPDPSAVAKELQTVGVTKVDEEVVRKMEQLEDNSGNVQVLFDEARSNPFRE